MERQDRMRILRQGVATSTSPILKIADYKHWLSMQGWEGEDTDSALYNDMRDFKKEGSLSWLNAGLQWMARQTDNLNVKLGATNALIDSAETDGQVPRKRIDRSKGK